MLITTEDAFKHVMPWLTITTDQVLDTFAKLPKAEVFGKQDFKSVFIPGTRKDRCLIVAHADTAWGDSPNINIGRYENLLYSKARIKKISKKTHQPFFVGLGIGADDRAGIALAWALRESGHSILITNGEERGGCGAALAMSRPSRMARLQDHQFAIEFDRQGSNEMVFYNVSTKAFRKYCIKETGYIMGQGTFTDICILCRWMCGVNISIGYRGQHSCNEILDLTAWANTANIVFDWLGKELPKFELNGDLYNGQLQREI